MRVIINADDFGLFREVNTAIEYCFQQGWIQQTSLMVNMPYMDEALEIAARNDFLDRIGFHLNLVEGVPLTKGILSTSLCTDGELNGFIMHGNNRFFLDGSTMKAVQEEIEAQMKKYCSLHLPLMHLDSHRHSHTNPNLIGPVMRLMKQYGLKNIRLAWNMHETGTGVRLYKNYFNRRIGKFNRNNGGVYSEVNRFGILEEVDKLPAGAEGITEIMIHPTMINGKLQDASGGMSIDTWISGKAVQSHGDWAEIREVD